MNKKGLIEFLLQAKKSTYAGAEGDSKRVLSDGSKEFVFTADKYYYRDRYFGSNPFAGEEVVFYNDEAIWVMNYRGCILDKTINDKEVYSFLKQALMNVPEAAPFRGPSEFALGDYKYVSEVQGDINSLVGAEKIYLKNNEIYELYFHGGSAG